MRTKIIEIGSQRTRPRFAWLHTNVQDQTLFWEWYVVVEQWWHDMGSDTYYWREVGRYLPENAPKI